MEESKRGKLIVFEGLDRCGKTTQIELLVKKLKEEESNRKIEQFKFPARETPIGKMIDSYLKETTEIEDHVIHLLFSANRWELNNMIKKHIEEGTTVILDRYIYSGIAFSSAKGLDLDWCKSSDEGLILPDLVIFLDISIDELIKRSGFGLERYEKKEFQSKVRDQFLEIHKKYYHLLSKCWLILDATIKINELHNQIYTIVKKMNNE
jgi:dTMP kinase